MPQAVGVTRPASPLVSGTGRSPARFGGRFGSPGLVSQRAAVARHPRVPGGPVAQALALGDENLTKQPPGSPAKGGTVFDSAPQPHQRRSRRAGGLRGATQS